MSVSQSGQSQELIIPQSISLSRPDVKVALFQFLFGEEDVVPGNHDIFWREFVNFVNLHPSFKSKLKTKLEGVPLYKINWKMTDNTAGIRYIWKYQTLLTPRYNTMASVYHDDLMKDLQVWLDDVDEDDGETNEEEDNEQFSIQRGNFRQDGARLPEGWEWRRDLNGRTLYIDHNNQVTTFQRPDLASVFTVNSRPTELLYRRVVSSEDDSQWVGTPTAPYDNEDIVTATAPTEDDGEDGPEAGLPEGWEMKYTVSGLVFYVDHNTRTTSWDRPGLTDSQQGNSPAEQLQREESLELEPLPQGWEEKMTESGKVYFVDHNKMETTWEDPRFGAGPGKCPDYSAQYKRKVELLMNKLETKKCSFKTEIKVRRNMIVEDSFREIEKVKNNKILKSKLWIEFAGEKGLDYGGVSREWFQLVSTKLFNPYYGLFEYSANDVYTLQINPDSGLCNEHHLQFFHFIGRIVGMAIFHKKLINGFFIRPFYSMMLGEFIIIMIIISFNIFPLTGKKICLSDMQYVDEFYYNSLVNILDNDPQDYGMTFQLSYTRLGETVYEDLVPGGEEVPVTNNNKLEYIDKVVEWRFVSRVRVSQISVYCYSTTKSLSTINNLRDKWTPSWRASRTSFPGLTSRALMKESWSFS